MDVTSTLLDSLPTPAALIRQRSRRCLSRRLRRLQSDPAQDPAQRRRLGFEAIARHELWSEESPRLSMGQLPLAFWQLVLGSRLHSAAAFWPGNVTDIDQAETLWCRVTASRCEFEAGQRVLEIGAHPGSLARWAETEIPGLEITLLALDPGGRRLLADAVDRFGPTGARVSESTLTDFSAPKSFDRIIAVEALGHSANPEPLLNRMLTWLRPRGRLLIQVACHWRDSYYFEPGDENGWMLPEASDGALLPGEEFLAELGSRLPIVSRWESSGEHYARITRGWLNRLERHSSELIELLAAAGVRHPRRTLRSWRNALLGQETMFAYRKGQEWFITQLLLASPGNGGGGGGD